jgi:hypothetical protein
MRVDVVFRFGTCRLGHLGRACASVGGSISHAVAVNVLFYGGACVCICVCACLRARAQFRHRRRWRVQLGERLVSPRVVAMRVDVVFPFAASRFGHIGRAWASVGSWIYHAVVITLVFDGGADLCVAWVSRACARAVRPPSAVATETLLTRDNKPLCREATKIRPADTTRLSAVAERARQTTQAEM